MSRIPDHVVERVHLGDATEAERLRVLADADAAERLAALPAADAAFLSAHPPDEMVTAIERRVHLRDVQDRVGAGRPSGAWRWGIALALPAAAVAATLMVAVPGPGPDPIDPGLERTTAKWGDGARLFVYRADAGGGAPIGDSTPTYAGDRLQLRYAALDATHGVIVSVDGGGAVTLHHPAEASGATDLLAGGERDIGFAYELDDAPKFERFYLVSDDQPVDVSAVLRAAESVAAAGDADRLPLPAVLEQTTVYLRKEAH